MQHLIIKSACLLSIILSPISFLTTASGKSTLQLSEVAVLLPNVQDVNSRPEVPIKTFGGCLHWTARPSESLEIRPLNEPILSAESEVESCYQGVLVSQAKHTLNASQPGKSLLYARDSSGNKAIVEVHSSRIKKLEIETTARSIGVGSFETLEVRAYDEEGNVFSTLEGLPFFWKVENQGVAKIEQMDSDVYRPSVRRLAIYKNGGHSDIVLLKGIQSGSTNISVKLLEKGYDTPTLAASVSLNVTEPVEIVPESILAPPGSNLNFALERVFTGIWDAEKAGSALGIVMEHFNWSSSSPQLHVNPKSGKSFIFPSAIVGSDVKISVLDKRLLEVASTSSVRIKSPKFSNFRLYKLEDVLESPARIDSFDQKMFENLQKTFQSYYSPVSVLPSVSQYKKHLKEISHQMVIDRFYIAEFEMTDADGNQLFIPENWRMNVKEKSTNLLQFTDFWQSDNNVRFVLRPTKIGSGLLTATEFQVKLPKSSTPDNIYFPKTLVPTEYQFEVFDQINIKDLRGFFVDIPYPDIEVPIVLPPKHTWAITASGGFGHYQWSSSNESVCSISPRGLVNAISPGAAEISVIDSLNPENMRKIMCLVGDPKSVIITTSEVQLPVREKLHAIIHAVPRLLPEHASMFSNYSPIPYPHYMRYNNCTELRTKIYSGNSELLTPLPDDEVLDASEPYVCDSSYFLTSMPGTTLITGRIADLEAQKLINIFSPLSFTYSSEFPWDVLSEGHTLSNWKHDEKRLVLAIGASSTVSFKGGPTSSSPDPSSLQESIRLKSDLKDKTQSVVSWSRVGSQVYKVTCLSSVENLILTYEVAVHESSRSNLTSTTDIFVDCVIPTSIFFLPDDRRQATPVHLIDKQTPTSQLPTPDNSPYRQLHLRCGAKHRIGLFASDYRGYLISNFTSFPLEYKHSNDGRIESSTALFFDIPSSPCRGTSDLSAEMVWKGTFTNLANKKKPNLPPADAQALLASVPQVERFIAASWLSNTEGKKSKILSDSIHLPVVPNPVIVPQNENEVSYFYHPMAFLRVLIGLGSSRYSRHYIPCNESACFHVCRHDKIAAQLNILDGQYLPLTEILHPDDCVPPVSQASAVYVTDPSAFQQTSIPSAMQSLAVAKGCKPTSIFTQNSRAAFEEIFVRPTLGEHTLSVDDTALLGAETASVELNFATVSRLEIFLTVSDGNFLNSGENDTGLEGASVSLNPQGYLQLELRSLWGIGVRAFDSHGKKIHSSGFNAANLALAGSGNSFAYVSVSPNFSLKPHNSGSGYASYDPHFAFLSGLQPFVQRAPFIIQPSALGFFSVSASVKNYNGEEIQSNHLSFEVFAPLEILPEMVVLLPGGHTFELSVLGGPNNGHADLALQSSDQNVAVVETLPSNSTTSGFQSQQGVELFPMVTSGLKIGTSTIQCGLAQNGRNHHATVKVRVALPATVVITPQQKGPGGPNIHLLNDHVMGLNAMLYTADGQLFNTAHLQQPSGRAASLISSVGSSKSGSAQRLDCVFSWKSDSNSVTIASQDTPSPSSRSRGSPSVLIFGSRQGPGNVQLEVVCSGGGIRSPIRLHDSTVIMVLRDEAVLEDDRKSYFPVNDAFGLPLDSAANYLSARIPHINLLPDSFYSFNFPGTFTASMNDESHKNDNNMRPFKFETETSIHHKSLDSAHTKLVLRTVPAKDFNQLELQRINSISLISTKDTTSFAQSMSLPVRIANPHSIHIQPLLTSLPLGVVQSFTIRIVDALGNFIQPPNNMNVSVTSTHPSVVSVLSFHTSHASPWKVTILGRSSGCSGISVTAVIPVLHSPLDSKENFPDGQAPFRTSFKICTENILVPTEVPFIAAPGGEIRLLAEKTLSVKSEEQKMHRLLLFVELHPSVLISTRMAKLAIEKADKLGIDLQTITREPQAENVERLLNYDNKAVAILLQKEVQSDLKRSQAVRTSSIFDGLDLEVNIPFISKSRIGVTFEVKLPNVVPPNILFLKEQSSSTNDTAPSVLEAVILEIWNVIGKHFPPWTSTNSYLPTPEQSTKSKKKPQSSLEHISLFPLQFIDWEKGVVPVPLASESQNDIPWSLLFEASNKQRPGKPSSGSPIMEGWDPSTVSIRLPSPGWARIYYVSQAKAMAPVMVLPHENIYGMSATMQKVYLDSPHAKWQLSEESSNNAFKNPQTELPLVFSNSGLDPSLFVFRLETWVREDMWLFPNTDIDDPSSMALTTKATNPSSQPQTKAFILKNTPFVQHSYKFECEFTIPALNQLFHIVPMFIPDATSGISLPACALHPTRFESATLYTAAMKTVSSAIKNKQVAIRVTATESKHDFRMTGTFNLEFKPRISIMTKPTHATSPSLYTESLCPSVPVIADDDYRDIRPCSVGPEVILHAPGISSTLNIWDGGQETFIMATSGKEMSDFDASVPTVAVDASLRSGDFMHLQIRRIDHHSSTGTSSGKNWMKRLLRFFVDFFTRKPQSAGSAAPYVQIVTIQTSSEVVHVPVILGQRPTTSNEKQMVARLLVIAAQEVSGPMLTSSSPVDDIEGSYFILPRSIVFVTIVALILTIYFLTGRKSHHPSTHLDYQRNLVDQSQLKDLSSPFQPVRPHNDRRDRVHGQSPQAYHPPTPSFSADQWQISTPRTEGHFANNSSRRLSSIRNTTPRF
eukprot:GHVP01038419.1.p1 GENE.GHVP01038419.1~~GHVP01038419.1.p1  ORF type:complete len:2632 (+),score=411.69 GHVP01038419.1:1399-9294(+)